MQVEKYQGEAVLTPETKNWAMGIHLSAFSGFFIPFGGVLGPLIIWLVKRQDHPFINQHGVEAMNFRLCLLIYYAVAGLLTFVVIGFVLIPVIWLFDIICTIIAAVKANNGECYAYPLSIRFLR